MPDKPENILATADRIIHGPRREAYGPPEKSFDTLASMWSVITGHEISPADVTLMMIALKLCREMNNHQRDNMVDICGYAALHEIIVGDDEL